VTAKRSPTPVLVAMAPFTPAGRTMTFVVPSAHGAGRACYRSTVAGDRFEIFAIPCSVSR